MSNRRRLPRPLQTPLSAWLASLDGARIPGGCAHCDACQVVHAAQGDPNLHLIRVYHDGGCPELAAREARQPPPKEN